MRQQGCRLQHYGQAVPITQMHFDYRVARCLFESCVEYLLNWRATTHPRSSPSKSRQKEGYDFATTSGSLTMTPALRNPQMARLIATR